MADPGGSGNPHQNYKMAEIRVYIQGDFEDEFFTLQVESKFSINQAMELLKDSLQNQNAFPPHIRTPRMKDFVQIHLERTCGIELDLRERLNARKRAASHLYRPMPGDYWIEDGSTRPFGGIFVGLNKNQTINQIFQRITEVYRGDLRSEIRFEVRGLSQSVDRLKSMKIIERFNLQRQRLLRPQSQQSTANVDLNQAFILKGDDVDDPHDPNFIEPIVPDRADSPDGSEPNQPEYGINIRLRDDVNNIMISNFSLRFEPRLTINENIQVLADVLQSPHVDCYLRFSINVPPSRRAERFLRRDRVTERGEILAREMANEHRRAVLRAIMLADRAAQQGNTRKIEDATRRIDRLFAETTIPFAVYDQEPGRDIPSYFIRVDRSLSLRVNLRIIKGWFIPFVQANLLAVNALQRRMTQAEVEDRFRWRMSYARYRRGISKPEDDEAELRLAVFPKLNLPQLQPPSQEWQEMEAAANLREEQERRDELNFEMMYGGPRRPDADE